jgi:transposase
MEQMISYDPLRKQAIALSSDGLTDAAIARILGVGRTTVWRWRKLQVQHPTRPIAEKKSA